MKSIKLSMAILLTGIFISCFDKVISPNDIGYLIPLKEGNKWIYLTTEYDSTSQSII